MSMDAISEKIAHFIGAFELVEQEARMRAEYDKFRAIKAEEDHTDAIKLRNLKAKESYKLEDVDAGVKMKASPSPPMKPDPELESIPVENGISLANVSHAPVYLLSEAQGISDSDGTTPAATDVNFTLQPPSAMAQVTYQINSLSDNDSFGAVTEGGFQPVSILIETLQAIHATVASLSPIEMVLLPMSADWAKVVAGIQDAAATINTGTIKTAINSSFETAVQTGQDAYGTFLDGNPIEEFTTFKDLLPEFIAQRQAKAEAKATAHDATTEGHDFNADFGKAESSFKVEDGHAVIAGANTLVNTASITSTWLDAEMIVVAGDVVRMDAISQINVIIDHDTITDALLPADFANPASTASNAAAIAKKVVDAAKPSVKADAKSELDFSKAPENWTVVRYDGPVTQINWVKQHTFTTDFDQAVTTLSGAASFLGLGENALTNNFSANELGYQYDLILVSGDLIDVNLINQLNILLDSDVVDTIGSAAPLPAAGAGAAIATGTSIEGSSLQAAAISGVPDSANPAPVPVKIAVSDPKVLSDNAPPAKAAAVSTGDNLTYNQASIATVGQDTDAAITNVFADVLDGFADGIDDIPDEVVEDPTFAGSELLRVLYVDGDFTTVNMVDQVNVLGDADQVHLARDHFADALQEQIQVTTGSNVLANVASIQDNGMDSIVMAQGETYSDALIHQANLTDTDVIETGASIADLANEAVAFLTDEINADTMGDNIATMTNNMISDTFAQSDIMQTMLS